jgi:hypothetical protein
MKQQEVFKKIGGIIREINEQYEYLETAGGVYNDLELELLVANSHFLTDHIEILKKLNASTAAAVSVPIPAKQPEPVEVKPAPETAESKPAAEPSFFVPVQAEESEAIEEPAPVIELEVDNKIEDTPEPEIEEPIAVPEPEPEPEIIRHELTLEDIGEDWDEEEDEDTEAIELPPIPVAIKTAEPEHIEEKPTPAPEPVAEQPEPVPAPAVAAEHHTQILVEEEQVITLNQRMSAQMSTSRVSDHLSAQPIADLKSAITLNDKLLYIKDLFNSYSLAYSEALDILNRMNNFEEAEAFLKKSYATKNNWADKQATVDKFYALLQRRYL